MHPGNKYLQCDSTSEHGCGHGFKCGYNWYIKKISGSFLDFNPKTDDGCCAYSKGLVELGAQSASVAWCTYDSESRPATTGSNPEVGRGRRSLIPDLHCSPHDWFQLLKL